MPSAKAKRTRKARSRKHFRMMFTCVGRRVELLRAFRRAAKGLHVRLEIHGTDSSWTAPALHLVDRPHLIPPIESGEYVDGLLRIVRKNKIELLIPLIDSELIVLADAAKRFEKEGCFALLSSPEVVRTCRDKLQTYEALKKARIDTPRTWAWTEAITRKTHKFPYFMKPRNGSASMGNYVIRTLDELHTFGLRVPEPIVQEFVNGAEHTLDVYTGLDGVPRCVVPRKRLEVRTGEVSKGLIVKDEAIMHVGRRVAEMLENCRGVITMQCIVTPKKQIRVIEINPRFGGGVPLAIQAGADFPRWILMEVMGRKPRIKPDGFRDDMLMLRFDDSVFVPDISRLMP
ncbi:MAG: ATP-grasp domain-containing protein [Phycisphaerales bacterium]|nr:MAG: ATP-grasp domain-containing protein [Phycisphaerales bacterium]